MRHKRPGRRSSLIRLLALLTALSMLAAACDGGDEGAGAGDDADETAAGDDADETAAVEDDGDQETGDGEADETEAAEDSADDSAENLEPPRVALTSHVQPSYVNTRFGPNTYASDFGMDFSDENFTIFDSHATATQTALSGRADIVGGSFSSHLLVREAGQDFQVFCPFVSNDDFVLAGRNGVTEVADLFDPETRVAVDSPGGAGDLILNAMLAAADAEGSVEDLPNVTVLESSGGRTTAFAADEADATIIHLPQYNQAAEEIDDPVIISSLYEDVPVFIKEAFAAPAAWLESNRDQAVAFCASVIKANRELKQDFDLYKEAVDTYVEEPPEEEELEEVHGLIQQYDFWPEDGGLSEDAVQFMADMAVASGILEEVPDLSDVVNRDILDAAVQMVDDGA